MFWQLQPINVQPDVIFNVFGLPITNTLFCTWLTIIALVIIAYFGTRRRDLIPSGMQNFVEWSVESILRLVQSVVGEKKGRQFFPLVGTFFFFILFANMVDILPGIDTIGWVNLTAVHDAHLTAPTGPIVFLFGDLSNKLVPWFRPPTSDLNLTFSMALVSVIVTQVFGFMYLGVGQHLGKYFQFMAFRKHGPLGAIDFFVGIVELITEVARILSFAFRLFGNIFAGSAVLALFALLVPALADIVFIPLEIFVAFVQALVFALLTLVFMQIGTSSHEQSESEQEAHEEFRANDEAAAAAGQ
jgi:F-type H+-transporting ATPase subunit a